MSDITLTAAMRNNLLALQNTAANTKTVQQELATGNRVNSALDNPAEYFAAASHTAKATALTARKDGMNEAIQSINTLNNGITAFSSLLQAAAGILNTAQTTSSGGLSALYTAFNTIGAQIQQLVADTSYNGTNFLNGTSISLNVYFDQSGTNYLTINGFDGTVSGLNNTAVTGNALSAGGYSNISGVFTAISTFIAGSAAGLDTGGTNLIGFSNGYNLQALQNAITATTTSLQAQAATFAANLNIVNTRLTFTSNTINTEQTGAQNLTIADTNQVSAEMLALQTQQSLGISSLSLASQAAQSVLKLFP